jgi:WD40 repeat protein
MKPFQDPIVLKAHESHINDLAFTPDSRFLLSAGMDNLIHQWSVADWSLAQAYAGHEKSVNSVCLSSNGSRFVTASSDKRLFLWGLGKAEPIEKLAIKGSSARLSDGDRFLAAVEGAWLTVMDFNTRKVLTRSKPFPKRTTSLAFSPDEKWLVVGGQGDAIQIFDLPSCEPVHEIGQAHEGFVLSLAFSPDGKYLASTGYEQKLRLWKPGGWDQVGEIQLKKKGVQSLSFSPSGKAVAVASDHTLTLVDTENVNIIQTVPLDPKGVYCLDYSPDGRWLACGSADKRLRIWEAAVFFFED